MERSYDSQCTLVQCYTKCIELELCSPLLACIYAEPISSAVAACSCCACVREGTERETRPGRRTASASRAPIVERTRENCAHRVGREGGAGERRSPLRYSKLKCSALSLATALCITGNSPFSKDDWAVSDWIRDFCQFGNSDQYFHATIARSWLRTIVLR